MLLFLLLVVPAALAWDPAEGDVPWQPDEIALFELVDSVNGTFYELMNISINATTKEIKKEYKKQAMVIHPDKNPETEEQFKQLAAVYNILKDDRTRAMYHRVLDEGLPDWRMPAFYDRQVQVVRHIGLLEGLITLLVLASFIQYGMGWANYLEQKFLAPKPKEKKVKKVKKSEVNKEESKEVVDEFEHLKPSVYDTLPFQLYELCKQAPELIEYAKGAWEERQMRKKEEAAAEDQLLIGAPTSMGPPSTRSQLSPSSTPSTVVSGRSTASWRRRPRRAATSCATAGRAGRW